MVNMHITDMLLHPFRFSKFSYKVSHVLQLWRNEVSYKHMVMNESLFKAFKTFTCVLMLELSSIIMREIQLVRCYFKLERNHYEVYCSCCNVVFISIPCKSRCIFSVACWAAV